MSTSSGLIRSGLAPAARRPRRTPGKGFWIYDFGFTIRTSCLNRKSKIVNREDVVAPRFSRARLIDTSDTQYRNFVRQIMIGKDNQRATRLPLPRELFGGEAEAALRDWLAQRFTLSDRR